VNNSRVVNISIVTYNSSSVIANCLDSIVSNCGDLILKIIIVDNASTDNTLEIISKYADSIGITVIKSQ